MVDETGDLKKGTASVGVQRRYPGTAGRIENCQVAIFLTYAAPGGHAFVDRRRHRPESWSTDPDRRELAGVPDDVAFATKPALASQMIESALMAGAPARWVAGDEVYGADPGLRITCWNSWHRWTTMAMLAHAFLTVLATVMNAAGSTTDEAGLIAVTLAEAGRLLTTRLARTTATTEHILAWSRWQRRHRHRARTAHYRRR